MYKTNKSLVSTYNTADTAVTVSGVTVPILGTERVATGCSVKALPNGFKILHTGLYDISYDVDLTMGATAGTVDLEIYLDSVKVDGAIASVSRAENSVDTIHVEVKTFVPTCCINQPTFTLRASGAVATITNLQASAERIA